ncbi:CKLF-like MARVEL transmembrane domain-containing 7 [Paramuricea clavata]|uniref:CKLF-like MARVEL transmembrane domain-containing 7 n=1 Tax=Paramuricea clavata TaxID=317549 RepID=A0A7D9JE96_PARCT|nr:CKLF-like MARVEL transmembrane domain-containing 7 [Paramuricea clavata]
MAGLGRGCDYFKSFPGILKIIEFIVLLIALGSVGYFFEKMGSNTSKTDNLKFFLFVIIVAWILVMAFWLNFVSGLYEKMSAINWPLVDAVVFAVWAVLLLISSALMADAVKYYEDSKFCALLEDANTKQQCEHLIVGTIFGFIAMVLFIVDSVIHFLIRNVRSTTTTTTTTITVG